MVRVQLRTNPDARRQVDLSLGFSKVGEPIERGDGQAQFKPVKVSVSQDLPGLGGAERHFFFNPRIPDGTSCGSQGSTDDLCHCRNNQEVDGAAQKTATRCWLKLLWTDTAPTRTVCELPEPPYMTFDSTYGARVHCNNRRLVCRAHRRRSFYTQIFSQGSLTSYSSHAQQTSCQP